MYDRPSFNYEKLLGLPAIIQPILVTETVSFPI